MDSKISKMTPQQVKQLAEREKAKAEKAINSQKVTTKN